MPIVICPAAPATVEPAEGAPARRVRLGSCVRVFMQAKAPTIITDAIRSRPTQWLVKRPTQPDNSTVQIRAWGSALVLSGLMIPFGSCLADTTVLAVSRAHRARVLAEGAPAWCSQDLHLRVELETFSPDFDDPAAQARLLGRLRGPIGSSCSQARTAYASVISPGRRPILFHASSDGGWVFTLVQPATSALAEPSASPSAGLASGFPQQALRPPATATITPPAPATSRFASNSDLATYTTPRDVGYASLVIAMAHQTPSLLDDLGTTRYWAQYRFEQRFSRLQNQEFKLQPLLAEARQDLSTTVAVSRPGIIVVPVASDFGEYDFSHHDFPIHIGGDQIQLNMQPCCQQTDKLPRYITIKAEGLDAIDALPMSTDAAQMFAEHRTRYGSVDRRLTMLVTMSIGNSNIPSGQSYGDVLNASVQSVDIVEGQHNETLVYRFRPSEIRALRDGKAAREAEAAHTLEAQRADQARESERQQKAAEATMHAQQEAANREQLLAQQSAIISNLQNQPAGVRLRNFLEPNAYADSNTLNDLRDARANAVLSGGSTNVMMLVQTDGSGSNDVPTNWPGHLEISVRQGTSPLSSGRWYLVSGRLTVPPGEDLPAAKLQADVTFACSSAECADAADPAAIVQHKLAALQAVSATP